MQRAIDPQLFEWPASHPHLIGSSCKGCGAISFPRQATCSRCCSANAEPIGLGTTGKLWTWTTQEFPPKSPPYAVSREAKDFVPFRVGYVELPGQIIVESRIDAPSECKLEIGMTMRLTFNTLFKDERGDEVIGFSFAPAEIPL